MLALSLWEPWASLLAHGVKRIETRTWSAQSRRRDVIGAQIAIHATARHHGWRTTKDWPPGVFEAFCNAGLRIEYGKVLATGRLVDCIPIVSMRDAEYVVSRSEIAEFVLVGGDGVLRHHVGWRSTDITDQLPFADFTPGRWAWIFAGMELLPVPLPARGLQSLWEWKP